MGRHEIPAIGFGMLALFSYVGVEVTIGSNLGELFRCIWIHYWTIISTLHVMYWEV
jgi:hypothetical protein